MKTKVYLWDFLLKFIRLSIGTFNIRLHNKKIISNVHRNILKFNIFLAMKVKVSDALLCLTFCDSMDCSQPGSFVHRILQTRRLEWVAIPFSRGSSWLRDRTHISYVRQTHSPKHVMKCSVLCPTSSCLSIPTGSLLNQMPYSAENSL